LKLKYEEQLSSFGFNFRLRRYSMVEDIVALYPDQPLDFFGAIRGRSAVEIFV